VVSVSRIRDQAVRMVTIWYSGSESACLPLRCQHLSSSILEQSHSLIGSRDCLSMQSYELIV